MKAAFVVIVISLILAASAFAQESPADAACGPVKAQFVFENDAVSPVPPQPDPSKALVYVIEEQKFRLYGDVTARVGLDGAWVGANRGNSYLFFSVEPGDHHLCTDWTSRLLHNGRLVSLAPLSAEAGKTYYFRARTSGARYEVPAIDLDPVNSDERYYRSIDDRCIEPWLCCRFNL